MSRLIWIYSICKNNEPSHLDLQCLQIQLVVFGADGYFLPNMQLYSNQQRAYQLFSSFFRVYFRLQRCGRLSEFETKMLT